MHFTKGYSYLWILIIVIIGAFFMGGGQFIFEDLNELGISPSPTRTPGQNTINPTSIPPTSWGLNIQKTCAANNQTKIVFTIEALTYPVYLVIQIKNDQGQFVTDPVFNTTINSAAENGQIKTFNAAYATRNWQAILYEGTSANPEKQKASLLNQAPTGC